MADDLDQKRKEKEIDALNEQLKNELDMWHLSEIDPGSVTINGYLLDNWLFALRDFLIEKGFIDEQEFLIFFKTRLLGNLKELRPKILDQIETAKKQVATPLSPNIFGPDGQKLN